MLLGIFFAILLSMFTGLTMLATNLLGFLEQMFVHVLFFWEKQSTKTLLRKNLVLHRDKNFLTSTIYALTLGCVIFLMVSASLEVQSMNNQTASFYYDIGIWDLYIYPEYWDPILRKHEDKIETFAYLSSPMDQYQNSVARFWNTYSTKIGKS